MISANREAPPHIPPRRRLHQHLYAQVLVAIVVGALVGHFLPDFGVALKPLGDAFIGLVKMIIAPVIFLTMVTGIAGMRELGSVGRVAAKAFAYFLTFSTLALIVGLIVANVVQPGAGLNIDPATLDTSKVTSFAEKAHETTLTGFLMGIIPESFLSGLTEGNILQTLFIAILFGVGLAVIGDRGNRVVDLLEDVSLVVFKL